MAPQVEFFFDVVSSYSYLASTQIRALEERTGVPVVYRPFFLGGLMKATGNKPPVTVPNKGLWLYKDLERWAALYEVPFKFNARFPLNTLPCQRAIAFVVQNHPANVAAFVDDLFASMWVRDEDPTTDAALTHAAEVAGVDAASVLAGAKDQAVKDQVRAWTDEAGERGAFGAPSFFVGEDLYWGNDRIVQLEAALASKSA